MDQASPEPTEALEASPDAEEGQGDGEPAPQTPPQSGGHKRNGYTRKIERLERQLETALSALNGRAQPQQPQPAASAPQLSEQEQAVEQIRAFARQEIRGEYQKEAEARQQQQLHADLQKQMEEARARNADFDEVLERVSHIPVPAHVQHAILKSGNKAEIMYSLAKNEAVLARINALPPLDAALEIGRWDAKLTSGAAPKAATTTRRPSAPAPIVPVTARTTSSVKRTEDMSYDEYKAWRKQGGGR